MRNLASVWKSAGAAGTLAVLAAWPWPGEAQLGGLSAPPLPLSGVGTGPGQSVSQASAVVAVVNGDFTSFFGTGTLSSASEPLGTGSASLTIPGLLSAESVHSAAMAWTDQVVAESSLGNLAMTVAGTGITADFVMSRAKTVSDGGNTGRTSIDGLTIGGLLIAVSGAPNQAVSLPGLSIIVNEQTSTAGGIVVNALRIRTLDGLTDVVVGSARASL